MGTPLSGKSGTASIDVFTVPAEVTGWNFEPSVGAPKYASNDTSGHKKAVAATKDFSGSITTKLDADGNMPFRIGDEVLLQLFVDDSGSNWVRMYALITSHPIPCDINDGEIVEVEYGFEPQGVPTYSGILAKS